MPKNTWIDHYSKLAFSQGYAARSVFKLQEIAAHHFPPLSGSHILDIGAAPGSWSQFFAHKTGEKGLVIAVDPRELRITPLPTHIIYIKANVHDSALEKTLEKFSPFHIIASDAATNTTGIAYKDSHDSFTLAYSTLRIARTLLKRKGLLLIKIFEGASLLDFQKRLSTDFSNIRIIKPHASRSRSKERYILACKR